MLLRSADVSASCSEFCVRLIFPKAISDAAFSSSRKASRSVPLPSDNSLSIAAWSMNTISQFSDHLANDAMPALYDSLGKKKVGGQPAVNLNILRFNSRELSRKDLPVSDIV